MIHRHVCCICLILSVAACSPTQDAAAEIAQDQRKALQQVEGLDADLQKAAEAQATQHRSQTE